MALKSALDLGIAESIQRHGGVATLPEIATDVKVHPSKIPSLSRLMRVLTATGVFGAQPLRPGDRGGEPLYVLTPMSRLLVGTQNQIPFTAMMLQPSAVSSLFEIGNWLQRGPSDPCIFDLTMHGKIIWEVASVDATFNARFNDGMVSDTRFIMDIAISE
ncbi:hypothetical protein PR202_gb20569 [Eleusine coracana subsp. coracana]|uniref:O-methyltransferase dimerisation domain-containing protein n=1 Tax=Eleusine coracana subsp. coracana TaxID=191504 RepID=A0AAV5FCK4_ELECO|nr:hypothetical protein PR202_gb20569 [Eleusine coracana subsp. coracana]